MGLSPAGKYSSARPPMHTCRHSRIALKYSTLSNRLSKLEQQNQELSTQEISYCPDVKCEFINTTATYEENKLGNGDIICLQKPVDSMNNLRYASVKTYFQHVGTRRVVHFRKLERPKEDGFSMELNKLNTYDEVILILAQHLALDSSSKIRLTPHNSFTRQPGEQPIKFQDVRNLVEMLAYCNQMSDILYFEILGMPLHELENMKVFKVSFYNSNVEEVSSHNITLPGESTVNDIIKQLREEVEMSDQQAQLRILQIAGHRICKVLSPNEKLKYIASKHVTYRAEEIQEDERNKGPTDCIIHVYHFRGYSFEKNNIQVFGRPFLFLARSGETLTQLKERIKKKLGMSDYQFSEFKFAFVRLGFPVYLSDDELVLKHFEKKPINCPWGNYLGIEHGVSERPSQPRQIR